MARKKKSLAFVPKTASTSAESRFISPSIFMSAHAFDQEVTLSTVMVDAIEAWLDTREG